MAQDYEKKTIRHIAGNVGADPELRESKREGDDDSTFVTFRVAVTRDYDKGSDARWYGVSVNRQALQDAVMEEIHKGSRVVIEGVPSTSLGTDGRTFYNFKAFRIGLVDYLAIVGNSQPDPDFDDDFGDDDEDL